MIVTSNLKVCLKSFICYGKHGAFRLAEYCSELFDLIIMCCVTYYKTRKKWQLGALPLLVSIKNHHDLWLISVELLTLMVLTKMIYALRWVKKHATFCCFTDHGRHGHKNMCTNQNVWSLKQQWWTEATQTLALSFYELRAYSWVRWLSSLQVYKSIMCTTLSYHPEVTRCG